MILAADEIPRLVFYIYCVTNVNAVTNVVAATNVANPFKKSHLCVRRCDIFISWLYFSSFCASAHACFYTDILNDRQNCNRWFFKVGNMRLCAFCVIARYVHVSKMFPNMRNHVLQNWKTGIGDIASSLLFYFHSFPIILLAILSIYFILVLSLFTLFLHNAPVSTPKTWLQNSNEFSWLLYPRIIHF